MLELRKTRQALPGRTRSRRVLPTGERKEAPVLEEEVIRQKPSQGSKEKDERGGKSASECPGNGTRRRTAVCSHPRQTERSAPGGESRGPCGRAGHALRLRLLDARQERRREGNTLGNNAPGRWKGHHPEQRPGVRYLFENPTEPEAELN